MSQAPMPPLSISQPYSQRRWSEWLRSNVGGEGGGNFLEIGPLDVDLKPRNTSWLKKADLIFVVGLAAVALPLLSLLVFQLADSIFDGGHDAGSSCGRRLQLRGRPERAGDDGLAGGQGRRRAHIKALPDEIPALKRSPLYHVGESYGGKLAAMIGVSLTKSIHAGDLDLTLGGVVIGDGWISPTDSSLTYARLLDDVSRLDENAIDDANKLAEKVSEQSAAGQFAASLQTFTGLIDLIDKSSGGVNIFNFLFNTSGVDLRVLAAEDKQKEVRGSPLMRFVGQDLSGSSGPNTIEGIMNGVIKEKLKIIPNNLVWQLATVAVFNALENEFMKPAINEVDELLSLGVNVTVYNGQLDVICSSIGTRKWLKKLKWNGLNDFFRVLREPMHYFCYPGHDSTAFRRIYKNLQYYWILEAGHNVKEARTSA
uniref:Carboxypeptidase n=1 Tax=Oryza nivara TaxID=4536 RepID=A0A0E0GNM7_ORYNI